MAHLAATVKTPTFATSPDRLQHRHTINPIKPFQAGFTLIELLVVLAIAGLLMALAPVAFGKFRDSAQYGTVLRTMLSDMRQARQKAMTQGIPVVFSVDLANRKYGVDGFSSHVLPEPLQVKVIVGDKLLQQNHSAAIVFLPEGGATGGSVDVLRPGGDGTRLRVDWLFGQVSTERLSR